MIEQKYNSTHPRIISVYVSQSEELMMNNKKRLAAFIAIISLVFSAMTLATPPAAHAVGCYGDWCSGQDADETGLQCRCRHHPNLQQQGILLAC